MCTHALRAAAFVLLLGLCAALSSQVQAQSAEPTAAGAPDFREEAPNLVASSALPFAVGSRARRAVPSYVAHPYTVLRVALLAPEAVTSRRYADIEDALALLSRSDKVSPPSWLDELTPFFEARAAVQNATQLDGEGYSFQINPLKLRCSFKIRLGGSLATLMPLFGGDEAASAASE